MNTLSPVQKVWNFCYTLKDNRAGDEIETEINRKGGEFKVREWVDHRYRQTRKKRCGETEEESASVLLDRIRRERARNRNSSTRRTQRNVATEALK